VQTILLLSITLCMNWDKEVSLELSCTAFDLIIVIPIFFLKVFTLASRH
jgi:hypothetical protein